MAIRLIADQSDALDAYSRVVVSASERLLPSVAHLRTPRGSGSGVVISSDGFLITSAHVVEGSRRVRASFVDGSGGALADGSARVVGINTAVAGVGLGLAVPVDATTRAIVAALMNDGRFRRAYLGIGGGSRPLPPRLARELGQLRGVEVVDVAADSPAATAGLRPEDLIVAVDGRPVTDVGGLQGLMVGDRIGADVTLDVIRGGRLVTLRLVPVELEF